jgi:hypothetical protein
VEADFARHYRADFRDFWRGSLTLRQVAVRVRHLPADSAVREALGAPDWSRTDYLLADLVHVMSGQPHPAHPAVLAKARVERSALAEFRKKARARRERLGITGSVLRRSSG